MARVLALLTVSLCGLLLAPLTGLAQSQSQPDNRCFPWQELRDGTCVAKAAPVETAPGQSRQLTTTPRHDPPPADAPVTVVPPPAAPVVIAPPPPPLAAPVAAAPAAAPAVAILCDGGTASGSSCDCPAGYTLLPASSGSGGTCVRSNAENCRGGVLTVAGVCLCDGRVTMSGEIYALEFLTGKCVPKRCPDQSYLRDGKCVASNDTRFSFTCRTGYIPDASAPNTAATGLHCVPDPTFCPADAKRKDGTCAGKSAVAIDCFESRCTCGPNADWVNYLCQCTAPYRNVNGVCVTAAADTGEKSKTELQSSEPSHKRRACPRGTVRTQSGSCVAVRPGLPDAGTLGVYYQRAQRYREHPPQQRLDGMPY
ncbi:MAG: hypothetical protein DI543_15690 [Bradyrhizobium icense]|nr:MAG: hypothetical protein DI543_15690 [Bradyrhizobium icense]